jgi:putative Holliday junction resolvase
VIVANPGALRAALARNQRLLGLDVGEKTVGLALSDPALSVASPLSTIRRT